MMSFSMTLSSLVMMTLVLNTMGERLVMSGSLVECKGKGNARICDGAVTKDLKSTTPSVQVCDTGKLKVQAKKKVADNAPKSGGECEWYGQLYCNGDIIIDLFSWKFLKKCGNGKMFIYGRTWQEVSEDPRFQEDLKRIGQNNQ